MYSHVKVRYLRRGPMWYSAQHLHDVDILITLLDQYDLTRVNSLYLDSSVPNYFEKNEFTCVKTYQIKPNLIKIAWIRNWFHRWLSKPWFGNYDAIFTSSQISKAFYDKISENIGIQSSCANACPQKVEGYNSPLLPPQYRASSRSASKTTLPQVKSTTVPHNAVSTPAVNRRLAANEEEILDNEMNLEEVVELPFVGFEWNGEQSNGTVATLARGRKLSNIPHAASSHDHSTLPSMDIQHQARYQFYTPRVHVDSFVFRLATSIKHYRTQTSMESGNLDALFAVPSNASKEAEVLFKGVDYIFTGSYFNVYRRIMDFDPGSIPQWKGRIVGNKWDRANVTRAWKQICTGLLPYETVKESYKFVKIVIDDANHATYPWGSVNSRVFDALASGALVISNGDIGMEEVFGLAFKRRGLTLPIYKTGQELGALLDYYLSHDTERENLVQIMQDIVIKEHSYLSRAEQLGEYINKRFKLNFTKRAAKNSLLEDFSSSKSNKRVDRRLDSSKSDEKQNREFENFINGGQNPSLRMRENSARRLMDEKNRKYFLLFSGSFFPDQPCDVESASAFVPSAQPTPRPSAPLAAKKPRGSGLCIGVRTTEKQEEWLPVFVRSLIVQHSRSKHRESLPIQIFIADTEAKTDFAHYLIELADKHNERFRYPYIQVLFGTQTAPTGIKNSLYGYDDTDRLLEVMLSMRSCGVNSYNMNSVNAGFGGNSSHGMTKIPLTAAVTDNKGNPLSGSTKVRHSSANTPLPSCEWIMFTNGDNMYNSAWFNTIAPLATSDFYDIIGWDFITHHPRGPKNDTPNQPINVALERGFVDLASVMIRAELFGKTNSRFLQDSAFTKDMFARDFMTVKALLPSTSPERVRLVHQTLLLHQ